MPSTRDRGQRVAGHGDAGPAVLDRQAGPAGQVGDRGRPVAAEVPHRDDAERLLAGRPPRLGRPLVEQHEGLLLAGVRGDGGDAFLARVPQHVVALLAGDLDAAVGQSLQALRPGQPAAAPQGGGEHLDAALGGLLVEADGLPPRRGAGQRPHAHQVEHPAGVGGRDEVHGAAHRPGADRLPAFQRGVHVGHGGAGQGHAERPPAARHVLRLHGAEPLHHARHPGRPAAGAGAQEQTGQPGGDRVHQRSLRPGYDGQRSRWSR